MITINIPGRGIVRLKHLVLDYNGTLAEDGKLLSGVKELLTSLAKELEIYVITADTFGSARNELTGTPVHFRLIKKEAQDKQKEAFVRELGPENCFAVGNGKNDHLMLKTSAIGVAVIQSEGASAVTVVDSDVVVTDIRNALMLLLNSKRLVATLRC